MSDEYPAVASATARQRPGRAKPEHEVDVESLSHEGRGIAHINGKVVFVEGALAGERVKIQIVRQQKHFAEAAVLQVLQPSPQRIQPVCPQAAICGGCSLQHWSTEAQIAFKQQVLKEQFQHFGRIEPEFWLPPLCAETVGYRRKARLGVRFVQKKNRLLIGFREKQSNFLTDMQECSILDARIGTIIPQLVQLIASLQVAAHIPQIEIAAGDSTVALIFRHLLDLGGDDRQALVHFCRSRGWQAWGQRAGPDSQINLDILPGDAEALYYDLNKHHLRMWFHPADFTQVHAGINTLMLDSALELLDLQAEHQVLDLFCGLGNFSLPMARKVAQVIGVEGSAAMTERASHNALKNSLNNTQFHAADLTAEDWQHPWASQVYQRILLDPPRSGAEAVVRQIKRWKAERVVYVSCNPATLARDAGILQEQGYRLHSAGVMDMFPHTSHVESIALFVRQ